MTSLYRNSLVIFWILNFTFIIRALDITDLKAPSESDHFLTLSADCTDFQFNKTIALVLHTSEPFYGSIYSRNYQSTCKVKGNGATATKLTISKDKECGVRKIHDKSNLITAATSQSQVSK